MNTTVSYVEANKMNVTESIVLGPMYLPIGNVLSIENSNFENSYVSLRAKIINSTITNNSKVNGDDTEMPTISGAYISNGTIGKVQDILSGNFVNKRCSHYPARRNNCSEDLWNMLEKECTCY